MHPPPFTRLVRPAVLPTSRLLGKIGEAGLHWLLPVEQFLPNGFATPRALSRLRHPQTCEALQFSYIRMVPFYSRRPSGLPIHEIFRDVRLQFFERLGAVIDVPLVLGAGEKRVDCVGIAEPNDRDEIWLVVEAAHNGFPRTPAGQHFSSRRRDQRHDTRGVAEKGGVAASTETPDCDEKCAHIQACHIVAN